MGENNNMQNSYHTLVGILPELLAKVRNALQDSIKYATVLEHEALSRVYDGLEDLEELLEIGSKPIKPRLPDNDDDELI